MNPVNLTLRKLDKKWIEKVAKGKAIYDWNKHAYKQGLRIKEPSLQDLEQLHFRSEDFRDALGTALRLPSEKEIISFTQDLNDVGVDMVTLDIFSSQSLNNLSESNKMTLRTLQWMKESKLKIKPVILARAHELDIEYVKRAHKINGELIVVVFQDLSEVRRLVEGWGSFQKVLNNLVRMVKLAKSYGIQVMAFTENLSITTPSHVEKYVISACAAGADWVGIADTAGRLFPSGSASLTRFVAKTILKYRQNTHDHRNIGIVFHGHNDLGNATNNSIAALSAGASVIDVVTNGLGERVGNTNLNEMVVNYEYRLRMHPANGHEKNRFDLTKLKSLSETYARITGSSLEMRQPVVGHSVFSTHFGIHANYYYKVALLVEKMHKARYSQKLINQFLKEAWKVYSAASPADFNSEPDVRVSPFSGASNVILRLKQMRLIDEISSINKTDSRVQKILDQAKKGWGELPDRDILWLWNSK